MVSDHLHPSHRDHDDTDGDDDDDHHHPPTFWLTGLIALCILSELP